MMVRVNHGGQHLTMAVSHAKTAHGESCLILRPSDPQML